MDMINKLFFAGSTGSIVFQLEGKYWRPTHDFRLPAGTLILAEKVNENFREGRGMRRTAALHIVDAYCLGGDCIFNKPLQERYFSFRSDFNQIYLTTFRDVSLALPWENYIFCLFNNNFSNVAKHVGAEILKAVHIFLLKTKHT